MYDDNHISPYRILSGLTGLLVFLTLEPYFMWRLNNYMLYIAYIPLCVVFMLNVKLTDYRDTWLFAFFMSILILAALCSHSNVFGIMAMMMLSFMPFASKRLTGNSYGTFKTIYISLISVSLAVWIVTNIGINVPYKTVSALNSLKNYDYQIYPLLVKPNITDANLYFRFHGPFDEPGVVGTMSLLMLFIEKFRLNRYGNIVLFVSGLLSFSLFFYMASALYAIYYLVFVRRKPLVGLTIVIATSVLYITTKDSPLLSSLIWDRMEWNTYTNNIAGMNRASDELNTFYDSIKGTSEFMWGVGNRDVVKQMQNSASIKNAVISYGMVVVVLYFTFISLLACHRKGLRKETMLIVVFIFITLYQRPGLFELEYLFLFTVMIDRLNRDKQEYRLKSST